MQATDIRQKLHHYVDKGDAKLLNLMYALAKEYNEDDDYEHEFTSDELNIFEERKKKRISGESKTYSWGEAKEYVTGKKKLE